MIELNNIDALNRINQEQRKTIDKLNETIRNLKTQHSEAIISLYYRFSKISEIGYSDNINKNIEMIKIADKTTKELYENIKEDLYLENDEEGKIIELVNDYEQNTNSK